MPWQPRLPVEEPRRLGGGAARGGAVVERWLFFAEAKHNITLYYGARSARADSAAPEPGHGIDAGNLRVETTIK